MYVCQFGTTGRSTVMQVFDTHQLTPRQGFLLTLRGQRPVLSTPGRYTDLKIQLAS